MTNWIDIHPDFAKKLGNKTYQQIWEKQNLTYQDAQEWISERFKPDDYLTVKDWKDYNFTPQETKSWREIGLTEQNDAVFASYLRDKDYQTNQNLKLEELWKEYQNWKKSAQSNLDFWYPKGQRNQITKLDIKNKILKDSLDLSDFVNLKELDCSENQLTNLDLSECTDLEKLSCWGNQLINLSFLNGLKNPEKLTLFDISDNGSSGDLSPLSRFVNLEKLELSNNSLVGSLENLKEMSKLKYLNINDTDIDNGLEYLPEDSLERFYCLGYKKKDAKVKVFAEELEELRNQRAFYEVNTDNATLFKNWKKVKLPKLYQEKLQEQIKLLKEENEKLIERFTTLEILTKENERLVKEQKDKIGGNIRDYLPLFEEKDKKAIQKLIEVHKAREEAEKTKQWKEVNQLDKQFSTIRQKLENKLGEDFMEVITMVLANFKELYQYEWELQERQKEKEQSLTSRRLIKETIEKNQQAICNININVENNLLLENAKVENNANLTIQATFKEQINKNSWLASWLKERLILEQEEVNEVSNFLQAKKTFLDARQETIEELKKCCNKLEKKFTKQQIIGEAGSAISGIGGAIPVTLGITQAIGESIKAGSNFWKIKLSNKSSEKFQFFLGNEETELVQLDNTYKSLANVLDWKDIDEKAKLFNNKYKVFDILIKDGIWENRSLNLERMEKAIISLSENLDLLKSELEKEKKQFKEFNGELEQPEQQIQIIHNPPKNN